ncbi:hypothetical protein [Maribacter sp. 2307ULW6-5]|uniref:hypothetical protein n=1 Tax=Maribacter sp. 2307ULW6-5 TaxID=3386275 RepID=UPI0039BD440F
MITKNISKNGLSGLGLAFNFLVLVVYGWQLRCQGREATDELGSRLVGLTQVQNSCKYPFPRGIVFDMNPAGVFIWKQVKVNISRGNAVSL